MTATATETVLCKLDGCIGGFIETPTGIMIVYNKDNESLNGENKRMLYSLMTSVSTLENGKRPLFLDTTEFYNKEKQEMVILREYKSVNLEEFIKYKLEKIKIYLRHSTGLCPYFKTKAKRAYKTQLFKDYIYR